MIQKYYFKCLNLIFTSAPDVKMCPAPSRKVGMTIGAGKGFKGKVTESFRAGPGLPEKGV